MLTKPTNSKRRNPWPLILLLGVTALSFVILARGFNTVAEIIVQPL